MHAWNCLKIWDTLPQFLMILILQFMALLSGKIHERFEVNHGTEWALFQTAHVFFSTSSTSFRCPDEPPEVFIVDNASVCSWAFLDTNELASKLVMLVMLVDGQSLDPSVLLPAPGESANKSEPQMP